MPVKNPNVPTKGRNVSAERRGARNAPVTGRAAATKSRRINLRATEREEDLLRRAATAQDTSVSDFILTAAVHQAEKDLADRRWFEIEPDRFDEFCRLLDHPIETAKLAELFARPPIFDRPWEVVE